MGKVVLNDILVQFIYFIGINEKNAEDCSLSGVTPFSELKTQVKCLPDLGDDKGADPRPALSCGGTMTQATLSREERHRLLDTLRGLDPTRCGLPKEHRRVRRRGVLEWMRIHVPPRRNEDRARVLRVLVKDVAAGGVGLYTRRVFAKNDRFVFPVHFMEGGGKLYLCEVVFCRRCSPRHFAVGAKFIASMEDPDGSAVVPTQWLEPTTPTD